MQRRKDQQKLLATLAFSDPIRLGSVLQNEEFTPEEMLAMILDIARNDEARPRERLQALNLVDKFITRSLRDTGILNLFSSHLLGKVALSDAKGDGTPSSVSDPTAQFNGAARKVLSSVVSGPSTLEPEAGIMSSSDESVAASPSTPDPNPEREYSHHDHPQPTPGIDPEPNPESKLESGEQPSEQLGPEVAPDGPGFPRPNPRNGDENPREQRRFIDDLERTGSVHIPPDFRGIFNARDRDTDAARAFREGISARQRDDNDESGTTDTRFLAGIFETTDPQPPKQSSGREHEVSDEG
jgi:hypothetical protein